MRTSRAKIEFSEAGTCRLEERFYHKLGYITREDMNPDTLELKKPSDPIREVWDLRFVCVYMEKQL